MASGEFDLSQFLSQNGKVPHTLPTVLSPLSVIRSPSGLRCPRCGLEPKRLPDGNPSDSIGIKLDGVEHPFRCMQCVQQTQMARRFREMLEDVPPLCQIVEGERAADAAEPDNS